MKKTILWLCFIISLFYSTTVFAADGNNYVLSSDINSGLMNCLFIFLVGFLCSSFLLYGIWYNLFGKSKKATTKTPILLIFIIAFITRLIIAGVFEGHPIDIACFKSWASTASKGLSKFYTSGGFVDYPPLYIYVLFIVEKIRVLLFASAPEWVHTVIIKTPAIVADILSSYIIFQFSKEKLGESKKAILISFAYLFNPATIINSCMWGQVDSIFMLILAVALIFLVDKEYIKSTIFFALAVLFKPQGLIFIPILFFIIVKEKNIKLLFKCFLTGVVTFILPVIPFTGSQRFDWIVKLYISTASSYKSASLNAYNLFSFLGANWKDDKEKLLLFNYSTWGFIFIIAITLFVAWYILSSKNSSSVITASSILITGVYVFSSKMHERYAFPVLMLLLIAYIIYKKSEILILYLLLTVTSFINVYQVFTLSLIKVYWIPANDFVLRFFSFINIILFFVLVYVFIKLDILKTVSKLNPSFQKSLNNSSSKSRKRGSK